MTASAHGKQGGRRGRIMLVVSFVVLTVLAACGQFAEGLRAMAGRGGTHEERDVIAETAPIARDLAAYQPKPVWATTIEADACDVVEMFDEGRILVGAVEVSAYLATPAIGPLMMFDCRTGAKLWQAPRHDLAAATYALLTKHPWIIVQAISDKVLHLSAFDPDSGAEKWRHETEQPARVLVDGDRGQVLVAVVDGGTVQVQALRQSDGQQAWRLQLPGPAAGHPIELLPMGDTALLVHDRLQSVDLASGRLLFEAPHPDPGAGAETLAVDDGAYLWRGSRLWMVDVRGQPRWGPVDLGNRVARVDTMAPDGVVFAIEREGRLPCLDSIHALSQVDGGRIWRHPVQTRTESAFLLAAGRLVYTTGSNAEAIDLGTGQLAWRTPLPMVWSFNEVPDLLLLRGDAVVVARERMGVAAIAAADGNMRWAQVSNPFRAAHYWCGTREQELFQSLQMAQVQKELAKEERSWWTGFIGSWNRRHKAMDVGSENADAYSHRSTSEWQATMALCNAMFALSAEIDLALKEAAIEALAQRKRIEIAATVELHARTFQGRYWLRPFGKRGNGICLVDLDTGMRADVEPCAPHYGANVHGPRLGGIALDATGERLFTVGVELAPEKWQRYVKYKWGMPYPSLQCFRLGDFTFRSFLYDDEALPLAADSGDAAKVAQLLDAGVWIDARSLLGDTALMAAAGKGNDELVRLLLQRGASVDLENNGGMSGIEIAAVWGRAATVRLLLQAGAAPGDARRLAAEGRHDGVLEVLDAAGAAAR